MAFVSQITAGIQLRIPVLNITLQNENMAVGSLIILFAIGYLVFCKADQLNKEKQGER